MSSRLYIVYDLACQKKSSDGSSRFISMQDLVACAIENRDQQL